MKPYRILKTFQGNQSGNGPTEKFEEGQVALLSDALAEVVMKDGLAEPESLAPNALAEDRETKVITPDETKPAKKKGKK